MKTLFTLLLTAFLLIAHAPATAQTEEQAPTPSAVSQKDCANWVKREAGRYAKAIKQLKKVKNDASAQKAAKSIRTIFEDKSGQKKDPCPDTELTDQHFPMSENKGMMKLATAVGAELNRLQDLIDAGKISEDAANALVDIVLANMKVAE
ncbi:MAG: hypothetical protein IKV82_02970 [Akkermansia sp.]|nr:hypothetical protein [Akkermansia sp.]